MARVDDYNQAFELGIKDLSVKDPDLLAGFSGADILRTKEEKTLLSLRFLNRKVDISWPEFEIRHEGSKETLPIQQQVLLVHYLCGAWASSGAPVTREWIAYQEVPDGRFYLDAFLKRAKMPLVKGFGEHPEVLPALAFEAYHAVPFDHGDFSVVVEALPLVPMALILWRGDDEFPPEGNILFDRNISGILSAEDIAWLAGMVVYPLIGMSKGKG
jgi:hypothetical protein